MAAQNRVHNVGIDEDAGGHDFCGIARLLHFDGRPVGQRQRAGIERRGAPPLLPDAFGGDGHAPGHGEGPHVIDDEVTQAVGRFFVQPGDLLHLRFGFDSQHGLTVGFAR